MRMKIQINTCFLHLQTKSLTLAQLLFLLQCLNQTSTESQQHHMLAYLSRIMRLYITNGHSICLMTKKRQQMKRRRKMMMLVKSPMKLLVLQHQYWQRLQRPRMCLQSVLFVRRSLLILPSVRLKRLPGSLRFTYYIILLTIASQMVLMLIGQIRYSGIHTEARPFLCMRIYEPMELQRIQRSGQKSYYRGKQTQKHLQRCLQRSCVLIAGRLHQIRLLKQRFFSTRRMSMQLSIYTVLVARRSQSAITIKCRHAQQMSP